MLFSSSYFIFKVKSTPVSEKHQWEQEQQIRRENLRKQCSSLGLEANITEDWLNKYKDSLSHILVSDKHKALYCYIPKVSCTNWKEVFIVMNGKATRDGVKGFALPKIHSMSQTAKWRLDKYSINDILHRLQTYTTFLVVRNPFSRTLSTYREKFEIDKPLSRSFRKVYGNNIHMRYGNHPQLKGKKPPTGGYDVTFQEYVKYVGDRNISKFDGDPTEHWKPMIDLCLPCTVEYDIIAHLETLEIDTANILERIGGSEYMDLVVGQSPHGTGSSKNNTLVKYYDQLTEDDIEGIRWRYKEDFKVFGYGEQMLVK